MAENNGVGHASKVDFLNVDFAASFPLRDGNSTSSERWLSPSSNSSREVTGIRSGRINVLTK